MPVVRAGVVDFGQIADAYKAGRLKFELRGLINASSKATYGDGATYSHRATVIATGDSSLVNLTYYLLFRVKRISGGDPAYPRGSDDYAVVLVERGLGNLAISGGYRTSSEKWDPEVIEVTPIGVEPVITVSGTPVRE